MSLRISSVTRLRLYSGDICRALTLSDNITSMIFSVLPSLLALIILFLCSSKTFSENSCCLSSCFNSVSKILWYLPRSTLYASIASLRLSVLAYPSLSWCRCYRQLTLIVKMALAECSYYSCLIFSKLNSLLSLFCRPWATSESPS